MGNASVSRPHTIEGVQFVLVPTAQILSKIRNHAQYGLDTDPPTYVISGLLDLDVDTSTLSTSLIGREDYVTALIPDRLAGDYVHISTQLPARYRREWDRLTVVGVVPMLGLQRHHWLSSTAGRPGSHSFVTTDATLNSGTQRCRLSACPATSGGWVHFPEVDR